MAIGADHKPGLERERQRVVGAGGRVEFQRCWRVISGGNDDDPGRRTGLAVSRSFGDIEFKEPRLCAASPQKDTTMWQPFMCARAGCFIRRVALESRLNK